MKKLLIIAVLIITANLSAQSKAFDFIDRTNASFDIELQNTVEIDGHTFVNQKSKDPVRVKSDLDGIKIYDSKREYQKRKCDTEKCKVIHLEPKRYGTSTISGWGNGVNTLNGKTLEYILAK